MRISFALIATGGRTYDIVWMLDIFLRNSVGSDDSRDANSANPASVNKRHPSHVVLYSRSSQHEHSDDCQLLPEWQLHTQNHWYRQYQNNDICNDIGIQQTQEHRHRLNAFVSVIWFDENGDWIAGEQVGEKEADRPADNEGEDDPDAELEFTQLEDVLV